MRDFTGFYRFILAVMVVFSHFYEHNREIDPMLKMNLGEVAVSLFFIISGYYVRASALRNVSFGHFLKKRFSRILPEFIVAIVMMFLVKLIFCNSFEPAILFEFFTIFPLLSKLFEGLSTDYFSIMWALRLELLSYLVIGMISYVPKFKAYIKPSWLITSSVLLSICCLIFLNDSKLSYSWLFGLGVALQIGMSRILFLISIVFLFFHGLFVVDGESFSWGMSNAVILTFGFYLFMRLKKIRVSHALINELDFKFGNLSYDVYIYQVVVFSIVSSFKIVEYSDIFLILLIIYMFSLFSQFIRKVLCI